MQKEKSALAIRAKADRDAVVLEAEAQGERAIKGDGDARLHLNTLQLTNRIQSLANLSEY